MRSALIVIDPQKGFAAPRGSLGRHYGVDELARIRHVVPRLEIAVRWHPEDVLTRLVLSRFAPGQMTGGDLTHGLGHLCDPAAGDDCEPAPPLQADWFDRVIWKSQHSAWTSAAFRDQVACDLEAGVGRFLLGGLLLEHCVRATALDLKAAVGDRAEVVICTDLVASRAAKYRPTINGPSIVQRALAEAAAGGVRLGSWVTPGEDGAAP